MNNRNSARGPNTDRGLPPDRLYRIIAIVGIALVIIIAPLLLRSEAQNVAGTAASVYAKAGAPVDGTSGTLAKIARPGSLLADTTNFVLYMNSGTKASPTWTNPIGIGTGQIATAKLADGAVTSVKLADDIAHTAQVALSAADIIAMRTTPKQLIAAPGANKLVLVDSLVVKMVRSATAFTSGGALEFRYTDGSGAKVSADVAASVVTTGGAGTEYNSVAGVTTSLTPVANAAIVLTNATGAFATGTGTAQVSIKYRIVTP